MCHRLNLSGAITNTSVPSVYNFEVSPYRPSKKAQDELINGLLTQLAAKHSRWGFHKMHSWLRLQGHGWNHKRVYRIYVSLKLNLRIKPRKRLVKGQATCLLQPVQPNVCWSMDFMSDALRTGQHFRTLNVIDDYNRQGLLIRAAYGLPAKHVTQYLDRIANQRGYPNMIRVDNGPEFTSIHFKDWAKDCGVLIQYSQPGKPAQNGFIERFNRTYREDILDSHLFDTLLEVNELSQQWLIHYNQDRPHQALADQSPLTFAANRHQKLTQLREVNSYAAITN